MPIQWFTELRDWLAALSPEFGFLLALPFAVAIAGLLSLRLRRQGTSSPPD